LGNDEDEVAFNVRDIIQYIHIV